VELIDQQLADDAENLAKIDEMIRAVNTAFPLLDPTLFGDPAAAAMVPGVQAKVVSEAKPPQVAAEAAADDASADDEPTDAEPTGGPTERDDTE
ncbi:MAG TPA: hypothetical protein PKW11_06735, partial [Pseudomonadota bacterium]|nr:hypothetical protein [Pseudomonadota bacterium]